jgi:hypothetical protein
MQPHMVPQQAGGGRREARGESSREQGDVAFHVGVDRLATGGEKFVRWTVGSCLDGRLEALEACPTVGLDDRLEAYPTCESVTTHHATDRLRAVFLFVSQVYLDYPRKHSNN